MYSPLNFTVLSVDDNTVLSVFLSHQQDALTGRKPMLFNIDGNVPL